MYVQGVSITPSPVPANTTGSSAAIKMLGLTRATIALESDKAGTLSAQRYADAAGTIPVGTAATVAVAAGAPGNSIGFYDGIPSGSVIVSFINGAGAVANLTNLSVNLAP